MPTSRLAQGDAALCRNATCAFRPSRRAIAESALSPDASEEGAIYFDGVAGSGVTGSGGLGNGGHVYLLFCSLEDLASVQVEVLQEAVSEAWRGSTTVG